jgi:hypothetical protein
MFSVYNKLSKIILQCAFTEHKFPCDFYWVSSDTEFVLGSVGWIDPRALPLPFFKHIPNF